MNQLPLMHQDEREIPNDMQAFIESPARYLPTFSLDTENKLALTYEWFTNKWSFVYFSHGHCLPACLPTLKKLDALQSAFASDDVQFLVIGLDSEHESADELMQFLKQQQFEFVTATAPEKIIELIAKTFIALFLKTEFTDGSYQIEQEHHLFLVDPKGRVYATFRPALTAIDIKHAFIKLRSFYAHTE